MNPSTYYVPEGETRTLEVVGVREGNSDAEAFMFVDGVNPSVLYLLCRVAEADTENPVLLKQFNADRIVMQLPPADLLDPGTVLRVTRYEGGNYEVELDPDEVEDAADAM